MLVLVYVFVAIILVILFVIKIMYCKNCCDRIIVIENIMLKCVRESNFI